MKRFVEVFFDATEENGYFEEAARKGSLAALCHEDAEGTVGIVLTNDETIHRCNLEFRNVDRPTDVLSFPVSEGEDLIAEPDDYLGDIMISVDTAARQALELGHSTEREIMFLAIHGTLHILGYDHMRPEDEEIMFKIQREILKITEG